MKKAQKKVSVVDMVIAAVMGFLTGIVDFVWSVVDAVLSLGEGTEPVKLEQKRPELKKAAPVKQPTKEDKPVVKRLPVPAPKKRSKK